MKSWVIVLLVTAIIIVIGIVVWPTLMGETVQEFTQDDTFEEPQLQNTGSHENISNEDNQPQDDVRHEAYEFPPCEGNEFFTVSPVSLDEFGGIVPLGELGPGGHNFPTEFIMFGMKWTPEGGYEDATVYSPGRIYITKITGGQVIEGGTGDYNFGYGFEFSVCDGLEGSMGLSSLSDRLLAEFVEPFDFCQEHTVGESATTSSITYTLCEKSGLMIEVEPGEEVGGIVGSAKNTLNFGIYDTNAGPLDFANPDRWYKKILYARCPLDYFSDEMRSQLEPRVGNIYGDEPRTVEPLCGEVEQDVPGTAQGAWFVEGAPDDPMRINHAEQLALVHDNVDPTRPEFVVGYSQEEIESREFFFEPAGTGFVNRDFDDVVPGETYCYDSLTGQHDDEPFDISLLLEMTDEDTLRLGKNSENSCGSGPWEFGVYTTYNR